MGHFESRIVVYINVRWDAAEQTKRFIRIKKKRKRKRKECSLVFTGF